MKRVNSLSLIALRVIGIFDFHAIGRRPYEKSLKKDMNPQSFFFNNM